jgi:hypothetical protein
LRFYPLSLGFAIGAAREASDAAGARIMIGLGLAILVAPTLLGTSADLLGLRLAHLAVPLLAALAVAPLVLASKQRSQ